MSHELTDSVGVAVIQNRATDNREDNLASTVAMIHEAADGGAKIVCTQELFLTRYFCQSEDHANFSLAETIPGPTTEILSRIAADRGIVIAASLFEKRAAGVYHNTAILLDADGSLTGLYRKMHIPDDPLYYEKFYFTPGDLGFPSFSTRYGRIGILICWDQWYPEAARLMALSGAQIVLIPTAIGWHPAEKSAWGASQHSAWETIQRSHAIANGYFLAAANRVGHEHGSQAGIEFWGQSFLCNPAGELLAKGSSDQPEIVRGDCDLAQIDEQRIHWPFLRDRRIDAYTGLAARYLDRPRRNGLPAGRCSPDPKESMKSS